MPTPADHELSRHQQWSSLIAGRVNAFYFRSVKTPRGLILVFGVFEVVRYLY